MDSIKEARDEMVNSAHTLLDELLSCKEKTLAERPIVNKIHSQLQTVGDLLGGDIEKVKPWNSLTLDRLLLRFTELCSHLDSYVNEERPLHNLNFLGTEMLQLSSSVEKHLQR